MFEDNETPKKIANSIDYINRVYNAICGFATDYIVDLYKEKDKFDYIKINTQDISVVDFLIPKEKKKELFDIGYKATNEYFGDYFPKKRKMLLDKYETLISLIIKFQKEFNNSKMVNAYLKLCEMFMFLCEEKKYLDSRIYKMIFDFKSDFVSNYKTLNFFGYKSGIINNKEKLAKSLLEIIKTLTLKVEELEN